MSTFIAFLRGINVSGHHIIKMADLKISLKKLNFSSVETYIQSGNVIFETSEPNIFALESQIKSVIYDDFGFEIPVFIMEASKFKNIYFKNPLLKNIELNTKLLYVIFCEKSPNRTLVNKLIEQENITEKIEVQNGVIYLYYPNGYSNSKVNNNFFERKLKTTTTARNWNTISKLYEKIK